MHGPTRIFWANLTPCSLKGTVARATVYVVGLGYYHHRDVISGGPGGPPGPLGLAIA
jgi:hypothetical protein